MYDDTPIVTYTVSFSHCNVDWEVEMTSPTYDVCAKCGALVEPEEYEELDEPPFDDYSYIDDPYYKAMLHGRNV